LFKEYLHSYAIDHCKSWKVIEYCFHHYLNHWLNRPIDSIKRSDVQLLVNKIGRDHGQVTANRTFELLRAVINKGKQWSLVEGENPATGITKFKMKPRARFVYEAEFPKLIAAIEAEPDDDTRDYIMLSLHTGARKSNILSMRWENIDLNSGVWTIPDTKNGTAQTILLTKPELEILRRRFEKRREHKVDNGNAFRFVFPGTGASGHWADPKKDWLRILKRAEITDLHLHDLRRTLGSYMAMTGASLSVIGNALNHKDLSTTRKVYAHSAHEAELKAREVAHERMFAKKEKPPAQVVELNQQKTAVEF
jgi:integrase